MNMADRIKAGGSNHAAQGSAGLFFFFLEINYVPIMNYNNLNDNDNWNQFNNIIIFI